MDNKQLKDLTADDLIGKPIWEFWISDNIEYVREAFDNEITEDSHVSYIVLTEFIFNNKTKHIFRQLLFSGFHFTTDFP